MMLLVDCVLTHNIPAVVAAVDDLFVMLNLFQADRRGILNGIMELDLVVSIESI